MEFVKTKTTVQTRYYQVPGGKVGKVLALRKLPNDPETLVLVKWWRGHVHPVPLSSLDEITTQEYYERR